MHSVFIIGPLHPAINWYGDKSDLFNFFPCICVFSVCFCLALLIFECVGQNQRASQQGRTVRKWKLDLLNLSSSSLKLTCTLNVFSIFSIVLIVNIYSIFEGYLLNIELVSNIIR